MALPLAVLAWLFVAFLLSRNLAKPPGWEGIDVYLKKETSRLAALSTGEISTLFSLMLAICLWLFAAEHLPEGASAVLSASLLFVLPAGKSRRALTWEQASRIDWSVILLFGGGMSLGQLLFDTKLAEYLGSGLSSFFGVSTGFGVSGISSGLALWTSELASNTASANIAVPVALLMSKSIGVSPLYPAMSASIAASFGFLLPVSTPPNALVYGTGKVRLKDMIRFGIVLDLFGFFLAWIVLRLVVHNMTIF
jgi:sodium-dependent dicarboxylate transporter 2/3/5